MARLKLVSRWFPRRFDVVDAVGRRVATISRKRARADIRLTVKGASYVIENREHDVALAHQGRETAHALFVETEAAASDPHPKKSIAIEHGGRLFALEDRTENGLFGAAKYVARERGRIVGTVKGRAVDLPETVPLHVRVFMAWLVAGELPEGAAG